jgi:hypothetical protein
MSVYLELFHGRHYPDEKLLDDWGFLGPVLGPFPFVQVTYNSNVWLGNGLEQYKNFDLESLNIDANGYILFAGGYYGDMCIVSSDDIPAALRKRIKETQKVFQTDPALLIKNTHEWVKLFAEWRFKNDTKQSSAPWDRPTSSFYPGKLGPARKQTHAKPGRGRRKNI